MKNGWKSLVLVRNDRDTLTALNKHLDRWKYSGRFGNLTTYYDDDFFTVKESLEDFEADVNSSREDLFLIVEVPGNTHPSTFCRQVFHYFKEWRKHARPGLPKGPIYSMPNPLTRGLSRVLAFDRFGAKAGVLCPPSDCEQCGLDGINFLRHYEDTKSVEIVPRDDWPFELIWKLLDYCYRVHVDSPLHVQLEKPMKYDPVEVWLDHDELQKAAAYVTLARFLDKNKVADFEDDGAPIEVTNPQRGSARQHQVRARFVDKVPSTKNTRWVGVVTNEKRADEVRKEAGNPTDDRLRMVVVNDNEKDLKWKGSLLISPPCPFAIWDSVWEQVFSCAGVPTAKFAEKEKSKHG